MPAPPALHAWRSWQLLALYDGRQGSLWPIALQQVNRHFRINAATSFKDYEYRSVGTTRKTGGSSEATAHLPASRWMVQRRKTHRAQVLWFQSVDVLQGDSRFLWPSVVVTGLTILCLLLGTCQDSSGRAAKELSHPSWLEFKWITGTSINTAW